MKFISVSMLAVFFAIPAIAQEPEAVPEPVIQSAPETEAAPADRLAEAEKELAAVQAERDAYQAEISQKMTELAKEKHEAEYADPACAKLRAEIAGLEGQLVKLRQKLAAQQKLVPEIAKVDRQRMELIGKIQEMMERERVLQNEVRSLKIRAPEGE
ncbi:MAG: hypothetical protein AB7T27_02230 [Kiritimatiellia bacterium]